MPEVTFHSRSHSAYRLKLRVSSGAESLGSHHRFSPRGELEEVRVAVERIRHQHVIGGARDVGRQAEGLEVVVDLGDLGLQRQIQGEVDDVLTAGPARDVEGEDDVVGAHGLAHLEEGEPPAGHRVGQLRQLRQPRVRDGAVGVGVVQRLLLEEAETIRLDEDEHGLVELLRPLHQHLEVGEVAPHGGGVPHLGEHGLLTTARLVEELVVLDGRDEALRVALLEVLPGEGTVGGSPVPVVDPALGEVAVAQVPVHPAVLHPGELGVLEQAHRESRRQARGNLPRDRANRRVPPGDESASGRVRYRLTGQQR
jgi:hypothetical protein